MPENSMKSGYAPVNGLKLYYELHGSGEPFVLLHGGVVGSTMFAPVLEKLAQDRQVITLDLQGHGRTADIDRPLRYELMADDIAGLIKYLGFEKVDLLGYSLGGGTALQVAIRHPNLLRKLVVISQPFKRQGWYPEVLAGMAQMGPGAAEGMKQSPLNKMYPEVNWATLFTKLSELLQRDYDWSKDVATMKVPTMLVYADADAVSPAHFAEFFGLLGGGKRDAGLDGSGKPTNRLAVLPDATHYDILSSPGLPTAIISFLKKSVPRPNFFAQTSGGE